MSTYVVAEFVLDREAERFARTMERSGQRFDKVGRIHITRQHEDLSLIETPQGAVAFVGTVHREADLHGGATVEARIAEVARNCWGRFIALFLNETGALAAVYREPSGGQDCTLWRGADRLVVSNIYPSQALAKSGRPSISWTGVAETLRDPAATSTADLLEGCVTVCPGGAVTPAGKLLQAWRPAELVQAGHSVSADELRAVVDGAVRKMTAARRGVLVEISGGLDSAIMATSLHASRFKSPLLWLNVFGPFAEADERPYARAVADKIGVDLHVQERSLSTLHSGLDLSHPQTLRPHLNRLDAAYDQLQADLCETHGLDGILTGKGGDVAFFQTPTSAIFADRLSQDGVGAWFSETPVVLARRLRRSAWRVMRGGLAMALNPSGPPAVLSPLLTKDIGARPVTLHPWLADTSRVPAGKRQQIVGFAANVELQGASRRSAKARLLHPALSQPVMEACLATPIPRLTLGGHDRLLARRAFADRLPSAIIDRRSKGELGLYYGQLVGTNLHRLRPHLLEGNLVGAGLINRPQLEAALQLDRLIWQGGYTEVLRLALTESWVRAWTS